MPQVCRGRRVPQVGRCLCERWSELGSVEAESGELRMVALYPATECERIRGGEALGIEEEGSKMRKDVAVVS